MYEGKRGRFFKVDCLITRATDILSDLELPDVRNTSMPDRHTAKLKVDPCVLQISRALAGAP